MPRWHGFHQDDDLRRPIQEHHVYPRRSKWAFATCVIGFLLIMAMPATYIGYNYYRLHHPGKNCGRLPCPPDQTDDQLPGGEPPVQPPPIDPDHPLYTPPPGASFYTPSPPPPPAGPLYTPPPAGPETRRDNRTAYQTLVATISMPNVSQPTGATRISGVSQGNVTPRSYIKHLRQMQRTRFS